jgi:hypothetical protein
MKEGNVRKYLSIIPLVFVLCFSFGCQKGEEFAVELSDQEKEGIARANDAASFSMEYEWSMISKDGNTVNAKGSWMYVFKKFGEAWKVVHSAGTHLYE